VVGGLEKLGGANLWALSDTEALELLDRVERSRRLLAALLLVAVRHLNGRDLRGVFGEEDLPSTADLLHWQLKSRPADARRLVELARELDGRCRRIGEALAAAEISLEQATVIVNALGSLPGDIPREQWDWAEGFLLDEARHLNAGDLALLGKAIRSQIQDQLHPFHHRLIHRKDRQVMMGADGHPYLIPPYSVDAAQVPRRNPLHRTFDHLYTGIWELSVPAPRSGRPVDSANTSEADPSP